MTEQNIFKYNLSPREAREHTNFRLIDKTTGLFIISLDNLSEIDGLLEKKFLKITCKFPIYWTLDPPQKSTILLEKLNTNQSVLLIWKIKLLKSLNDDNWPSIS